MCKVDVVLVRDIDIVYDAILIVMDSCYKSE